MDVALLSAGAKLRSVVGSSFLSALGVARFGLEAADNEEMRR